jgi:peptidoglycan/xylan/chitin deacetylase (PgdA/CDA1 family)
VREREGRDSTFVFTNDDAGSGDVHLFHELLDFLERRRVRGTFFTVPHGGDQPLDERPEWIAALQRARAAGHEIGLHGFRHRAFEFGRPPDFMLDLMGPASWDTLRSRRQELHDHWRPDALRQKLEQGIATFERTLGLRPQSWRSPCCAVSTNLYLALAAAGIPYDSSLIVNPQGWPYAGKDFTVRLDWEAAHPPYPFRYHGGVIELPVVSEYTWYLADDQSLEKAWELITGDYERVVSRSGIFVAMSHFYAMTGPYRRGLELYDRFFDYAESRGPVHYRTVAEAAARPPRPWPV